MLQSVKRLYKYFGILCALLLIAVTFSLRSTPQTATAAPSTYLNFQARLMASSGSLVPDGTYNIEFKLFNASSSSGASQGSCSGDANCVWTETRVSGNKVNVVNGYFSVNLGSVTAFGGSIDWTQQHWLTMNIGGSGAATWDGEMTPRIQLTAVPLAFVANNVNSGNTSTASTNSAAATIQSGNATGATSNSGNVTIDAGSATGTAGQLLLGATNASLLQLGRTGGVTTLLGSTINLNSATIATNQSALTLFNTTATTVTGFGAATQITLGAADGITNVNSDTLFVGLNGSSAVRGFGTAGFAVGSGGQTAGSTSSGSTTILSGSVSGATSNSGAVILQSGNSSTSGNTGALSVVTGNATSGNSGSISIDNGTASGTVGTITIAGSNSSALTLGRTGLNVSVPGTLSIGAASSATGTALFRNSSGSGSITLTPANPSSTGYTITLPAETGTVCTTATVCSGYGAASGSFVNLQASTPGTPQTGNLNISGAGIFGGNIGVTGTITSGLINSQTISSSANFTGTLVVQGASITSGTTGQAGSLIVSDGSSSTVTFKSATQVAATNYDITVPAVTANDTICLASLNNCASAGANTALSNLASVAINTALLAGADNTIDLGSGSFSFRTLYADTSVLTPLVDSSGALNLGTGSATSVNVGGTTNTTAITLQGAVAATYDIGTATGTGQITLGKSAATNTISIGSAAGAAATQTINIGTSATGSSTTTINIGSTVAGATTLQSAGGVSISQNLAVLGGSLTAGAAAQAGSIIVSDGSSSTITLKSATQVAATNYDITVPAITGNDTICLASLNNCTGTGANTALSNLSSVAINTALLAGADNTIDLGSGSFSFRTLYADTSVLTPLIDAPSAGALSVGTSTATSVAIGKSGITTTNGGAFTVTELLTANLGATVTGGTINLNATGSGVTNITTGTASGAVNIGNSAAGAITLQSGSTISITSGTSNALTLDSSTTGTVNLGTNANAKAVNIGTGAAVANTISIGGTGANVISLGDTQTGGSISIGAAMTGGTINIGGTGAQTGTITLGGGTGVQAINLATGGTGAKTVVVGSTASTGTLTLQSGSGGTNLTSTGSISVGTSDTTGTLLILDTKTGTGDPTAVNGGMYYNSALHSFRCARDGAWSSCAINEVDHAYEFTDDFIGGGGTLVGPLGNVGWMVIGTGQCTAVTYNNNSSLEGHDHPGFMELKSGTTNGDICRLGQNIATVRVAADDVIKTTVSMTGTVGNGIYRTGWTNQSAVAGTRPTSGVWWEANSNNDGQWQYCYANNGAANCADNTNGTPTIAANTWVKLEIRIVSTTAVDFIYNGTTVSLTGITFDRGTTNNLMPTMACGLRSGSPTPTICELDYFQWRGVITTSGGR